MNPSIVELSLLFRCSNLRFTMASSLEWGAELLPLPALHTLAAGAFSAVWLWYADLHAKNLPSFKHAIVGFGLVLAAAAATGHFVIGNSTGTAAAILGAAVAAVAFTRQHTAIVIMATIAACTAATLLVSDELSLHSAHGRGLAVLILGYVFSRRGMSNFRQLPANLPLQTPTDIFVPQKPLHF